ncbi:hypothetical protein CLU81_0501 [Flavobacterium sp. 9]|uniref:hypothetical protein n=1 Tax=Flavobacterium sp. 9 TaxID=2035198 RepID=UPI000C180ACF|nr:hypothetical protein [Flavobacterium sp. 9]PIF30100.1 hypothetical protein CLU81_0501 [Flavobacterium sp. 9]
MKKLLLVSILAFFLVLCSKSNRQIEIVNQDLKASSVADKVSKNEDQIEIVRQHLKEHVSVRDLNQFVYDVMPVSGKYAYHVKVGNPYRIKCKLNSFELDYYEIKDKNYFRVLGYRIIGNDTVSKSICFLTDKNKIYFCDHSVIGVDRGKSLSASDEHKNDTIQIINTKVKNANDYIIVHLLDRKVTADENFLAESTEETYRLDFYINKVKAGSQKIVVEDCDNAEWMAYNGFLQGSNTFHSSFIQVHLNVFGEFHQQYLFHLNKNKLQLVHQWYISANDFNGDWIEFFNMEGQGLDSFYSKRISFRSDFEDRKATVGYLDLIRFSFEKDCWKKQLMTPQGEVYWAKNVLTDDFYAEYPTYTPEYRYTALPLIGISPMIISY